MPTIPNHIEANIKTGSVGLIVMFILVSFK
jgi:hypothetical protein